MTQAERQTHTKNLMVTMQKKMEPLMTQMEQWSILSNVLNYVQHSRFKFHEPHTKC